MKYGFLFGAGAEIGYGLPSGGKFALDIFRHDVSESKKAFREMRDGVDNTTNYASFWLPKGFKERISAHLGKRYSKILSEIPSSTTEKESSRKSIALMISPKKRLRL